MMTALVDADSLLYRVLCPLEEKVVWNEQEVETLGEEPEVDYFINLPQAYKTFDQMIENILFATGCDDALLVFTSSGNFRDDLPIQYKANRKTLRKPTGFKELLAYAYDSYNTKDHPKLEADDIVVYLKTKYPDKYVLCAIDKDVVNQTVGTHYNYNTDEETEVTQEEATYFAYYQTLTGDVTDGYKGCPDIGPIKAKKILADCKDEAEMWEAVVTTYESKKLTERDAILTMNLANMHQFDGRNVVLWKPL